MAAAAGQTTNEGRRPHPFWTLTEGRAIFELGSFYAMRGLLSRLPRGDGHSVIVLPGFLASDASTQLMRDLLTELGYDTHGWSLGRNVKIDIAREQAMIDLLDRVHDLSGRKVSLIGWSLGGVFAREVAKSAPDKVRQVISLGSPISNKRSQSAAGPLFEAINGERPAPKAAGRYRNLAEAPPVPTTSILTRGDGIVPWRDSLQTPGPMTDNIEVLASHIGLGVNPTVMYALADRLAQPEGEWKPFAVTGWRALMFRKVSGE